MKNKITFPFFVFLFASLFSCSSEKEEPLKDFISYESEGKVFTFSKINNPSWNKYFRGQQQDQVGITLENTEGTLLVGINLLFVYLDRASYPIELSVNSTGSPFPPVGDFQLYDLVNGGNSSFGPEDGVNFVGDSSSDFYYQINSYENGILEGTFTGSIYTRTGKSKLIQNGKFRVAISEEWNE